MNGTNNRTAFNVLLDVISILDIIIFGYPTSNTKQEATTMKTSSGVAYTTLQNE